MALFKNQFANVVEWEEYRDDIIFWKWTNREIKKGSRLIIRPGQDAIFMFNGKIEGVFEDDGDYDIESQIIPFLSTLKGFKFGFNSGMRAEVLFINTKEFTVKWGTKNPINVPAQGLPGGMPIRCFGTFSFKVNDRNLLIDRVAGIKNQFGVDDVRERVVAILDQLLMKWIAKEGRDMFNLQASAYDISKGLREDLDIEVLSLGLSITAFAIQNFNYPEEVQKMQKKVASHSMVGDMGKYTQMQMLDSMGSGGAAATGPNMAAQMAQMQMGMMMGQQMTQNLQQTMQSAGAGAVASGGAVPKFCPNCGQPTNGMKFCGNCGQKLA